MNARLLHFGLMAAIVGAVLLVIILRRPELKSVRSSTPRTEKAAELMVKPPEKSEPPPQRPPEDPKKQGVALHDASLVGLIQNARMAQQRGDNVTRNAMLSGLRKSPERSRELIAKEISDTRDRTATEALQALMEELK